MMQAAVSGGREIMRVYSGEIAVSLKEDNTPLTEASVTPSTVILTNVDSGEAVEARVVLDENIISIYPGRALEDYTTFELQAVGYDIGSLTGNIYSEDGDDLPTTITICFQTAYVAHSESEESSSVVVVDASGVTTTYDAFALVAATPPDGTLYLDPDYLETNGVQLQFNYPVDAASVSGAITVEQRPFVDRRYAVSDPSDIADIGYTSPSGMYYSPTAIDTLRYPSFTVDVSGAYINIHFAERPEEEAAAAETDRADDDQAPADQSAVEPDAQAEAPDADASQEPPAGEEAPDEK
jgi:hypothetical protein